MWGFRPVVVVLIGLITLALVAPWAAPKAVADGDRLGCDTRCKSAGQYGAAGNSGPQAVTFVSSGTVTPDQDGYVPVIFACHMPTQCAGSVTLSLAGFDNQHDRLPFVTGRSTLLVNGGATRTIGIPVPAEAITYVRSQGPKPMSVTTNVGAPDGFQGLNDVTLTLAAPG